MSYNNVYVIKCYASYVYEKKIYGLYSLKRINYWYIYIYIFIVALYNLKQWRLIKGEILKLLNSVKKKKFRLTDKNTIRNRDFLEVSNRKTFRVFFLFLLHHCKPHEIQ